MKHFGRLQRIQDSQRGFTLLETAAVLMVLMVISSMTFMSVQPVLRATRVDAAYDQVLMRLRQGRQAAVDERRVYLATFLGNNQVVMQRLLGGNRGVVDGTGATTAILPYDMQFLALSGIPNTTLTSPDGFGVGGLAVQFDYGVNGGVPTQIYFQPDGSARDINMNLNNGVVYLARANDLYSSRAISLVGGSGRLRGWRLYKDDRTGLNRWVQQ